MRPYKSAGQDSPGLGNSNGSDYKPHALDPPIYIAVIWGTTAARRRARETAAA